MTKKKSKLRLD